MNRHPAASHAASSKPHQSAVLGKMKYFKFLHFTVTDNTADDTETAMQKGYSSGTPYGHVHSNAESYLQITTWPCADIFTSQEKKI